MKKQLLALTLMIVLLFITIPSSASTTYYNEYAVKLSEIGVFKGTGNGFELDREPTRLEGLIMLIRLLGKEDEAEKLKNNTTVFTDVPSWGNGYVNYAYNNGLTKGIGNNLFGSNDKMNGKSFITLLLRSLGYDDSSVNNDFTWADSIDFAKSIGLLEDDLYFKIVGGTFTRDYVAKSSYNTLLQAKKDGTGILVDSLVKSGDITNDQATSLKEMPVPNLTQINTGELSSIEIGKLADAVVMIEATGFDGSMWTGSGFYTTTTGHIVTNYHVVNGASKITIKENDGTLYNGVVKVIGYSEPWDLAVLDIEKTPKMILKTSNSDSVVLGQEVYAIGSPLGLQNTMSSGIISSVRDGIFQITAPISHGSSGGVLLNTKGEAIGVTYAGINEGENLGFAIPINQYTSLNKNLSLDLASFNNKVSQINAPDEVQLVQLAYDTIDIIWSEVSGAEYYKVYMSESPTGPFEVLVDEYNNDLWYFGGVTTSGLEPGSTYYVKVTAVKGTSESLPTAIESITLEYGESTSLTYEEYADYLLYQYGSISLSGYTTYFSDATVDIAGDGSLAMMLYIEDYYEMINFLDIISNNPYIVENILKGMVAEAADYYGINAKAYITYYDMYDYYPTEFEYNQLYDETILYDSYSDMWSVYYPFIYVYYDYYYNYYDVAWGFE